ncbi:hypothetical protein QSH57_004372 [Fusarium oxysporum f. sp. vasinfectum]|nr:hypothetical protein QSH57_004372 [Fusarium oxysporum f. sp. vasinfectum]
MTHSGRGDTDVANPQMLEIEWDLWNTMFPPQTNNGSLDIQSDCFWSSLNSSDS